MSRHDQPHLYGDDSRPWERQWGETSRQYAGFCFYRDLGPSRSIDKAYHEFCLSKGKMPGKFAPGMWHAQCPPSTG